MENNGLFRAAAVALVLAASVYFVAVMLQLAGFMFDLLIVVFLAWIISSNSRRLSLWLQRMTHVPFGVSVALAYVIILLPVIVLLALFVPLAVGQAANLARVVQDLSAEAPAIFETVQTIAERFGVEADLRGLYETRLLAQAGAAIGDWLSTNAFNIARTTAGTLFQLFLVFSLSVYMVLEGNRLGTVFLRIAPHTWHDEIEFIYGTMDRVFSQWLRGVVIIGTIFATMTFVVMLIAGLPYAVAFSLIAGLLVLVPFIGDFIAIGLPVAAALSEGEVGTALVVGGILVALDVLVINMFISPRVLGNAVRLPTVFVILSVLVGAKMAGAFGAFLGVPVAGLIYSTVIAFADRAQGRTANLEVPSENEEDEEEKENDVGDVEPEDFANVSPVPVD